MTFLGVGTGMPIMILRAAVLAMVLWGSLQTRRHRLRRGRRLDGPDGDDQPDRHRAAVGHGGEADDGLFRAEEGRPGAGLRRGGLSGAEGEDRRGDLGEEALRAGAIGVEAAARNQ